MMEDGYLLPKGRMPSEVNTWQVRLSLDRVASRFSSRVNTEGDDNSDGLVVSSLPVDEGEIDLRLLLPCDGRKALGGFAESPHSTRSRCDGTRGSLKLGGGEIEDEGFATSWYERGKQIVWLEDVINDVAWWRGCDLSVC